VITDALSGVSTMSFATHYRQGTDGYGLDVGSRAAPRVPALRARALATVRHGALDRRLAEGADSAGDRELAARAWQITRASARERLATALDAVLIDAERPRSERRWSVRVCREEVEVARGEIQHLAERLRDPRPVSARGVALARRLLSDGTGPLYAPSANDELYRQLHHASVALD
jgi:hypothetical protein